MNYALAFNTAVNLIVGITLILAWRRDRRHVFTRDLGTAFLTQAFVPVAYGMSFLPWTVVSVGGLFALILLSAVYLALVLLGSARLAGFSPTRRHGALLVLALLLSTAALLLTQPRLAHSLGAALHIAAGVVAMGWLWRLGAAERLAGLMLVLIGANQFIYVAMGEAGIGLQAAVAAVLRLTLGLALLHAAGRRSADEAQRLRERFQQLAERSPLGMAVVQGEQLLYANPALVRIYGLPSVAELRKVWGDAALAEPERTLARERHRQIIAGERAQISWLGLRHRAEGAPIHLRFTAWRIDWDGVPAEQVLVTDETLQHNAAVALRHQSAHDELTGLPNRSALLRRLQELCLAPTHAFVLVLLDVDRFKLFNEAHGHALGDQVLRTLSATLQACVGGEAEVMRLGEDEFALLARDVEDEDRAVALALRVRKRLTRPLAVPPHEFFLDVSMGVALYPATARDPDALLRAANAAMNRAKAIPGTSVQFAQAHFEQGSGVVLDAEQALRAGIGNDEFVLFYQPKISARSGKLVGFESLVRWDRPGQGRIGPGEFIPAAERTGLIVMLGRLILAQACQQLTQWRAAFKTLVPVAVNVSPLQLLDPDFPERVANTLRQYDVPPALLTLEITESAAVTHLDQARDQIQRMRAQGIEVALDDFGTGFSSLNLLRSLPLAAVKIDRTLVEPLPAEDAAAVVKAICDLAGVLKLEVVAEGVETEAQANAARLAGCDVLQGTLYAQPLTAAQASEWLSALSSPGG